MNIKIISDRPNSCRTKYNYDNAHPYVMYVIGLLGGWLWCWIWYFGRYLLSLYLI